MHLQPLADSLAGLRGATAAHRHRTAGAAADFQRAQDVLAVLRYDDAQWRDLVHAGVGRIQGARDGVEAHFAFDLLAEFPF